jgi:AP-1-like transcription factor
MDYSYFSAGPQPYQFFGLPPTPRQSNTPPPGEYSRPVLSPGRIGDDNSNRFPTSDMDAAFAAFQQNFRYDPASLGTQHRNSLPNSPTKSPRKDSTISIPDPTRHGLQPIAADLSYEDQQRGRSSSEEKESLKPAQSRRKAQNRAA